MRLSKNFNLL